MHICIYFEIQRGELEAAVLYGRAHLAKYYNNKAFNSLWTVITIYSHAFFKIKFLLFLLCYCPLIILHGNIMPNQIYTLLTL
jgi:hypothetical protein